MSDVEAYDFVQSSPLITWIINHSLNTVAVAVDAFVSIGGSPEEFEKAMPDTQVATNTNTVTITWSSAQSGVARVVGGGDH